MKEFGKKLLPVDETAPERAFDRVTQYSIYKYPYDGASAEELVVIAKNYLEASIAYHAYISTNRRIHDTALIAIQLMGQELTQQFLHDDIELAQAEIDATLIVGKDAADPFTPRVLAPNRSSRIDFTPPSIVVSSAFMGAVEKSPPFAVLKGLGAASAMSDYFHNALDPEETEIRASALQAQWILDTENAELWSRFEPLMQLYPQGVRSAPADVWYPISPHHM